MMRGAVMNSTMGKPKFENEAARILIDSKLKSVVVEWTHAPTSAEYRDVLIEGLALMKQNQFVRWIADVRLLGAISEADQIWSNKSWFPQALEAGLGKIGIIVSDDIFNQLSVEEIMSRVDSAELSAHYFSSVEEAMNWIK